MIFFENLRTIAFICLTIFGCTGNLLTLIIINQRFFRKTSSAAFILGLCIADCIVLCLHTLQIIAKTHPRVTAYDCIITYFIDVFRLLSVWIVCSINIERCSLVFNPCHMPRLISRIKSRIIVLILFLLSLLTFSHYAKHLHIARQNNFNQTNSTLLYCKPKPEFRPFLWLCIKSCLNYWLTIPLCSICNFIIIKHLHQASRIERSLHPDTTSKLDLSSKQRQLTAMLLASSIAFVLTASPTTLHTIYLSLTQRMNETQYIIHIFTSILLHFHHASNFLVFVFSCARFRFELIRLFNRYCHCPFCTISINCRSRTASQGEPIVYYSSKQQRTPVKLLTIKSDRKRRRSPNEIVLLATNAYPRRNGRDYGYSVPAYCK